MVEMMYPEPLPWRSRKHAIPRCPRPFALKTRSPALPEGSMRSPGTTLPQGATVSPRTPSLLFMVVLLLPSCREGAAGTSASTKRPAATTCQSITQGPVPRLGESLRLIADVPAGSTVVDKKFFVREEKNGAPWVECAPATQRCNGATLPNLNFPGADPGDSSPHYAADVRRYFGGGDPKVAFSTPIVARMVITYNTTASTCRSLASWEIAGWHTASESYYHMIPPGKTQLAFRTFGRELDPSGSWKLCDASTPNTVNQCDPRPWQLRVSINHYEDTTDRAKGYLVLCKSQGLSDRNIITAARRGCRTELEYQP